MIFELHELLRSLVLETVFRECTLRAIKKISSMFQSNVCSNETNNNNKNCSKSRVRTVPFHVFLWCFFRFQFAARIWDAVDEIKTIVSTIIEKWSNTSLKNKPIQWYKVEKNEIIRTAIVKLLGEHLNDK